LLLVLLFIGLISILGQVVLLRELLVAFYGVELIYVLALGIWLFWSAAGAMIGRRTPVPAAASVMRLLVVFAALLPLDIVFVRALRLLWGGVPGAYLPFGHQLLALSAALLPMGVVLGLLFQRAAKRFVAGQAPLALAYAIESAGGLIGGLAATLLLRFGASNVCIAWLGSFLAAGLALGFPGAGRRRLLAGGLLLTMALAVALALSPQLDRAMTQWNHPHLIASRDSPYGRISIIAQAGQFAVFENDALAFETQSTASEEFVHMAALQHPRPRRVLVAGGGGGGIVREVLKHRPLTVDYVELNSVLLEMTRRHLPEDFHRLRPNDGLFIHHADPRRFIGAGEDYDLILIGMPEPTSGQSNRFYTLEFFRQCADALAEGGVMAFQLRSAENLWTRTLSFRNASIYHALSSVFSQTLVLPGVTNTIMASQRTLDPRPRTLIRRYTERALRARFVTPSYIRYLYTNDRFFQVAARLEVTAAPANSDLRPICYQYSSIVWLSKFIPSLMNMTPSTLMPAGPQWMALVFAAVLVLGAGFGLGRAFPGFRRLMLVVWAGFLGMVLETMLLLHYQAKNGALYQNIGLLLMAFMAGLAAGAYLMSRTAGSVSGRRGGHGRRVGRMLLIACALLALGWLFVVETVFGGGLLISSGLLFAAGALVAGLFAYASRMDAGDQVRLVPALYAGDLAGGCIGSLLASLLLIPFWGMAATARLLALLALAALVLI